MKISRRFSFPDLRNGHAGRRRLPRLEGTLRQHLAGQQRFACPRQLHKSGFRFLSSLDEKGAVSSPRTGCRASRRPGPRHGGARGQPDLCRAGKGGLSREVSRRGGRHRLRLQSGASQTRQIPTSSRMPSHSSSNPAPAWGTGLNSSVGIQRADRRYTRVSSRRSLSPDIPSIIWRC